MCVPKFFFLGAVFVEKKILCHLELDWKASTKEGQ